MHTFLCHNCRSPGIPYLIKILKEGEAHWQGKATFRGGIHCLVSLPGHNSKPREPVNTMLEKRLGLRETRDLLELACDYIDVIKLTFGTSALYPEAVLREKIKLIRSYGVDVCPGGTLFEIARWQGKLESYLQRAAEFGFTGIEVSDGTIPLTSKERHRAIESAKAHGFKVTTEVGKKNGTPIPVLRMQQIIADDLEAGADKVIIEGRESARA